MDLLVATNKEDTVGYGDDHYTKEVTELIKQQCNNDNIDVYLFVGGTPANIAFLKQALRPHQGVLCASFGHINCHEAGAIEATGHKVLPLKCGQEGKITADQVEAAWLDHYTDGNQMHMVQPAGVYISQTTETGAIYSKKELMDLSQECKKRELFLYLDGARLGYALSSKDNDVSLEDLAHLTDGFYIGGTKCGALIGEAMVLVNDKYKKDFFYIVKQDGALLAKGRLAALQFKGLLTNNVYTKICGKANEYGQQIATTLKANGFTMFADSPTNQQFVVFDNKRLKEFEKKYNFAFWANKDENNTIIRICTSWSTKKEDVKELLKDISESK